MPENEMFYVVHHAWQEVIMLHSSSHREDDLRQLCLLGHIAPEDAPALCRELNPAACRKESSIVSQKVVHAQPAAPAAAPAAQGAQSLWSRDYIFDIGVNFLVYCVHFLLMLWSTAYAIKMWNASIGMAGLASGIFIVGALCARIPAGRFIDFIGRRRTFLIGTAVFALMIPGYKLAPGLATFLVVRFIHGMSFGTTSTAASTSRGESTTFFTDPLMASTSPLASKIVPRWALEVVTRVCCLTARSVRVSCSTTWSCQSLANRIPKVTTPKRMPKITIRWRFPTLSRRLGRRGLIGLGAIEVPLSMESGSSAA